MKTERQQKTLTNFSAWPQEAEKRGEAGVKRASYRRTKQNTDEYSSSERLVSFVLEYKI